MPNQPPPPADDELVLDAPLLRALAHPVRTQLLSAVRRSGSSTATRLAHQLGLDTGTTSYHLRQLAASGLIVEDEEKGDQRDRWWKASHARTRFDNLAVAAAEPDLATAYMHNVARTNHADLLSYLDAFPTLPRGWQQAATMDDSSLDLTARELTALVAELESVVEKYRGVSADGGRRRGSRPVAVHVHAFPRMS
jgi:DNA-binding transcriptional ArsR family regulator